MWNQHSAQFGTGGTGASTQPKQMRAKTKRQGAHEVVNIGGDSDRRDKAFVRNEIENGRQTRQEGEKGNRAKRK